MNIHDAFWSPRIDGVSTVHLTRYCIDPDQVRTPDYKILRNSLHDIRAESIKASFYDDSDVYKALEAIAYAIKNNKIPGLEAKAWRWNGYKIAAAQLPDGYHLNTYYTLNGLDQRWTDMSIHEDYKWVISSGGGGLSRYDG